MATKLTSLYAENQTSVVTDSISVTGGRLVEIYIVLFSDPAVEVYFDISGFGTTWTLRAGDPSVIFDKPMMYSGVPASGGSGTITITARDSADDELANLSIIAVEVIEHGANVPATDNGDLSYEQAVAARGSSGIELSAFDAVTNVAYGWFIVFAGSTPTATPGTGLTLDGGHTNFGWPVAAFVTGVNVPDVDVSWSDDGFIRHAIALEIVTVEDEPEPEEAIVTGDNVSPGRTMAGSAVAVSTAAEVAGAMVTALRVVASAGTPIVSSTGPAPVPRPLDVRQMHSGHSLTDPGWYPYPGIWVQLMDIMGVTDAIEDVRRSTAAGSGMIWRWDNDNNNPSARHDIGDFEVFVTTEGVPLPLDTYETTVYPYLSLFVNNAWENGNGGAGIGTYLFTTWTDIYDGDGDFRARLDSDAAIWEGMADYADANSPPGCPPVRIIPGHLMMAKFYDDIENEIAPAGVASIADYFRDGIHVNDLGGYAWCMIHFACLFETSPVGLPRDLWRGEPGWGDSADTPGTPHIPTEAQALYIQETVWNIVRNYSRTGIGGGVEWTSPPRLLAGVAVPVIAARTVIGDVDSPARSSSGASVPFVTCQGSIETYAREIGGVGACLLTSTGVWTSPARFSSGSVFAVDNTARAGGACVSPARTSVGAGSSAVSASGAWVTASRTVSGVVEAFDNVRRVIGSMRSPARTGAGSGASWTLCVGQMRSPARRMSGVIRGIILERPSITFGAPRPRPQPITFGAPRR